ncbi:MAG: cell division protein FtsA [Thermotogaceae bacterium]|nr:cell division protein FtsA [Thermotogaceae bacterium]
MIFALDVGTRKVAGLIADREGEKLKVYDIEVLEHEKRAMIDGAVHDVERVAITVNRVKKLLEERNEIKLTEVAIALAGRFLKTLVGEAAIDISDKKEIAEEDVNHLEITAVKDAMKDVNPDEMFCVGYSVLSYELDGAWMMNLTGHRGKKASVKVIAAFLPVQVVDAMSSVMNRVGLKITHMTLEPIAAIEVAVPEEVRLLNIALVDVGAGTSDIAISNDGIITAYGMVPKAGDELTEAIAKEFLLDFYTAEFVKRHLRDYEEFEVKDVLDAEKIIKKDEIMKVLEPVINEITSEISKEIIELNGKPPKAIMVVGGGAKVPGFVEKFAEMLGLPRNRVSLKSVENLPSIEDHTGKLVGSDMVTPAGIAKSALFGKGSVFSRVYVNGQPVKLMGLGGKYTVMQVLLQAGYDLGEIIGMPSPALVYEVNGKVKSYRGLESKVKIIVNGKEANTRDLIEHGDRIEIERVQNGEYKPPTVRNVIDKVKVKFYDGYMEILPKFLVNGEKVSEEYEIKDGDKIEHEIFVPVKLIKERIKENFRVEINGRIIYPDVDIKLLKGKKVLGDNDEVKVGVEISAEMERKLKVKDIIAATSNERNVIRVKFNGKEVVLPLVEYEVYADGKKLSPGDFVEKDMKLTIQSKKLVPMVATLLANLNLDMSGFSRYKIYKNGVEVGFAEFLNDGDEVEFIEEG